MTRIIELPILAVMRADEEQWNKRREPERRRDHARMAQNAIDYNKERIQRRLEKIAKHRGRIQEHFAIIEELQAELRSLDAPH